MFEESPTVSAVVPVFNASTTLVELVKALRGVLAKVARSFEVILVNDGSTDDSWAIISKLASTHDFVRGIDLGRNFGQHNALLCGIRAAVHEVVVTIDGDLQNPPEAIPALLAGLSEADVVYGTPVVPEHSRGRRLASWLTKLALKRAMGVESAMAASSYRAFRKDLREAFADYRGSFVSLDVLLTWGTTAFASVPVEHRERVAGRSSYTLTKLVTHALNLITGFSVLPLQLASLLGFSLVIFGIGLLVFVLGRWLISGSSVPGFTFLATVITVFAGAQLFALGVIGEYLGRVHFRILARPTYFVRSTTPAPD